jgi:hypothetical protein
LPLLVLAALTGLRLPTVSALVAALYSQQRLYAEPTTPALTVKTLWTGS